MTNEPEVGAGRSAAQNRSTSGKVYLVSDVVTDHSTAGAKSPTLEIPEQHYIRALLDALEKSRRDPVHLGSPKELIKSGAEVGDVVLSIWSGAVSRNRRLLVSAACETLNLFLVGADAYASLVSQDKILARHLARASGFHVPAAAVKWNNDHNLHLDEIPAPYVVKPSREGTSIGIHRDNLVSTADAAKAKAEELFHSLGQPILIESFVPGEEISINIIERQDGAFYVSPTRTSIVGKPDYFDHEVYAAEIKKFDIETTQNDCAPDLDTSLPYNEIAAFLNILSPVRYMRIDGRWSNGTFWFVESSPDTHLGPKEAFARGFTDRGISYADLIDSLVMQDFTVIERVMPRR